MGAAKRRGTFEERKAQAILEGRSKNAPSRAEAMARRLKLMEEMFERARKAQNVRRRYEIKGG